MSSAHWSARTICVALAFGSGCLATLTSAQYAAPSRDGSAADFARGDAGQRQIPETSFSIVDGVLTTNENRPYRPMPGTPQTVPPPVGATVINFDSQSAPCLFSQSSPLRDLYAPLGVVFAGVGPLDGGAVLNECGNFDVVGQSSPNFLAFSSGTVFPSGGFARFPETLLFTQPVTHVQVNVGGNQGGLVTLRAFDASAVEVGSASVSPARALQTISVSQPGIVRAVIEYTAAVLVVDDLAFVVVADRDHDGLSDDDEVAHGTDPNNPDTDGDGLLDGFEVDHGFNPLVGGEQSLDPDGDGLNNLGEQVAGTDPADADSDDDGLSDGTEVHTTGTDPLDADSDDDGLMDGAEVTTYGTDPLNPDTDGGGVTDGNEVNRDGTNPLDPLDDRKPNLGMVMNNATAALVIDPSASSIVGRVSVGPGPVVGDCAISPDGSLGFATDFNNQIWVVDLASTPPQLASGPNPIHISNPGEDVATTADGRFVVTCDGTTFAPVSVIDVAARVERSTFSLGTECSSVDVCPDGSVLVASHDAGRVRRLVIDVTGHLSDTGESLLVSSPMNVYCAPDGASGVVVKDGNPGLRSFQIPGLVPVSDRALSGNGGVSGAMARDGTKVYTRSSDGSVAAFSYDAATATIGATPLFIRSVGAVTSYYGIEQLALDHAGSKLYVPDPGRLRVYNAVTGAPLPDISDLQLTSPTGICFRPLRDRDHDGLSDDDEAAHGTDPNNPDTDGDGLLDGFEVDHGFNPLVGGEQSLDPDGDGLNNLGEQAAGTDPADADSDDDGLSDGAEVHTTGTDPLDADSDHDGLMDGAEVNTYLTDPLNPDTDGGGVTDGNEVNRDGTNPLDPLDDRKPNLGMVMNNATAALVIDPSASSIVGSVSVGPGQVVGDCAISPDGSLGFATDFNSQVWVVDLASTPPRLAPGPNPIHISNPGEDVATTEDGRFVVTCDGTAFAPVSVIDVAARVERSTFSLGTECSSVDVCPDGSVLVASHDAGRVRRLVIDATGHLSDTGESLFVSAPMNVYCAPDGASGVVVKEGNPGLRSFQIPGLVPVSNRALSGNGGVSGAIARNGTKVYTRSSDGSVAAFSYDAATGAIGAAPLFTLSVGGVAPYYGIEQLALDHAGSKLYVPDYGRLRVYNAVTGASLPEIAAPQLQSPTGICFRPLRDRDHDGLSDDDEVAHGTDPNNPDTDGDGLLDGFEVDHGFDPLVGGEQSLDPDGDGLDNLGEQSAGTDPADADSDDDGLSDGAEVHATGTDPLDADSDDDGVLDGADNCPLVANASQSDLIHPNGIGDACDDPDGDGVADISDNCPDASNTGQANADGDGTGDACDPYPDNDLEARPTGADFALTGQTVPMTYRLVDRRDGRLLTELAGVRVTVTLDGSAVFGTSATQGVLVSGGGTSRALVEFVQGLVTVDVSDAAQEVVSLGGEDTEHIGIVVLTDIFQDFEASDGGFTHSGVNDVWQWGVPTSGPGQAVSGAKVWATNLSGNYPDGMLASLVSPRFRLGGGALPRLEFQSWFSSEGCCDPASVEVSTDGFVTSTTLETLIGFQGGYQLKSYGLSAFVGSAIQVRFRFSTDGSVTYPGWYIDDFAIRGGGKTVEFLSADGDFDGDGLSNAAEVALGTNPRDPDSDHDGHADGADNCPLAANASQSDLIHPNGIGDACDDPDGDAVVDLLDNCPDASNTNQADADQDGTGDACDDCTDPDGDGFGSPGSPSTTCPLDNCPTRFNPTQEDQDQDSSGDMCDNCPDTFNPDQSNIDGDVFGDVCDPCPHVPNGSATDLIVNGDFETGSLSGWSLENSGDGTWIVNDGAIDPPGPIGRILPISGQFDAMTIQSGPGRHTLSQLVSIPHGVLRATLTWSERILNQAGVFVDPTQEWRVQFRSVDTTTELASSNPGDPPIQVGPNPHSLDVTALLQSLGGQQIRLTFEEEDNLNYFNAVLDDVHLVVETGIDCQAPTAQSGADRGVECIDGAGTSVRLDGSASTDPDSTPGTNDGISLFEWFEDFGSTTQRVLGIGETLDAAFSAGEHHVTLRVTDQTGETDTDETLITVDDSTPPTIACPAPVVAECQVMGRAEIVLLPATASDSCYGAVAITNDRTTNGADASGAYGLGSTTVRFTAVDGAGNSAHCQTVITVVDTTPPVVSVDASPNYLWPPNHAMYGVHDDVQVLEACDPSPHVILESVVSSDPDDAPGGGDGSTTNDVDAALIGTADFDVLLRAERAGNGPGRTYTIRYRATDTSGNTGVGSDQVVVPHDQNGISEPIALRVANRASTTVSWEPVYQAQHFDIIRGSLEKLRAVGSNFDLGPVVCLELNSTNNNTVGNEDTALPAPGKGFFYLVQFNNGTDESSYGEPSAAKARVVGAGSQSCH